jgi:hypothetical protein
MVRNTWRPRAGLTGVGVVLAMLLLSACQSVVSSRPWFSPAADAPRLRDGVWRVNTADQPCTVDEAKPVSTWPGCASAIIISGSKLTFQRNAQPAQHFSLPYVVAAGDPVMLQLEDFTAQPTARYGYAWLAPVRRDSAGRIVETHGWIVACGPSVASNDQPALFPGVTMQNGFCVVDSVEALRAAAKSTAKDAPTNLFDARWLRAGDR